MNELVKVEIVNGKPCVTSLQVAEAFGKEHFHVMRDIRETIAKCSKDFAETNFGLNSYSASLGDGLTKECPMYVLTKDGFVMLAMGYTTPEAMRVKEAYIAKFNEMEEELRRPHRLGCLCSGLLLTSAKGVYPMHTLPFFRDRLHSTRRIIIGGCR